MAGSRRKLESTGMIALALAIWMLAVVAAHGAGECNPLKFVYPVPSNCSVQAKLYRGYHYLSASFAALGGMEPEWDPSNSTYYVRFTGNVSDRGAKYAAFILPQLTNLHVHPDTEDLTNLHIEFPVYLINTETKRALKWRQEGSDEFFLIEEQVSETSEAAIFRFRLKTLDFLPCVFFPSVICPVYYLISDPGAGYTDAGFLAYPEEGAIYIKAAPTGSTGDLPIFIIDPNIATPPPLIRTVTD